MGTGTLEIGSGSSVREGMVSNRDVLGSPTGPLLVSVDTEVGEGFLRGAGGGTGTGRGASSSCLEHPEVHAYMEQVRARMLARWKLPPGVPADQSVNLRFKLDLAGSASAIELVRATSNALGASAIDALRAASPFPPLPERARCLAQFGLTGRFTNPGAN
jgi:TonB family protein